MDDAQPENTPADALEHPDTARLDTLAVAIAFGLVSGISLFVLAWWVRFLTGDRRAPLDLDRAYPRFNATVAGSTIGAFWGFLSGLFTGWLYGLLYNGLRRIFHTIRSDNQHPVLKGGE